MARATFEIPGMRIHGKLWGAVLAVQPDGTTVMRDLPARRRAPQAGTRKAAARFQPVAEAWRALSPEALAEWRAYSEARAQQPYRVFTALGTKCLQLRPGESLPSLPPASAFAGDGIEVVARASVPANPELAGTPSPRVPPSARASLQGEPSLTFVANAPNAPGVVTELLTVRLASPNRRPQLKAYRTQRFVAFAAGALEAEVPCEPGAWACAVRFVREATGQEVGIVEMGVVRVE